MKKTILIVLLFLSGCASAPKKDLTSMNGLIAAEFNLEESEVNKLKEKGFNDDLIIKILVVVKASPYEIAEFVELGPESVEARISEVAMEAGITEEFLAGKTEEIKNDISKYLQE